MPAMVARKCLILAIGLALVARLTLSQETKPQPVRITAQLSKPDSQGRQTLTVRLAIENGWYIYANPVGASGPIATTVQVSAAVPLREVQVEYPQGKTKTVAGETYRIYQDEVEIRVLLQRGESQGQLDSSPLTVAVRYQACNDQICLPPRTVKLTVNP
ncbi:MAG: protein-disulfide reductase DsbD N-terminal domain-containing protein [Gemmatales bacterium]|nr:protein-disulfide reductase DsbD N-terminal domain-containing protein [Gemmatales bacterium]